MTTDQPAQKPSVLGFSREECWSGVPLLQVTSALICFLGVPEAALLLVDDKFACVPKPQLRDLPDLEIIYSFVVLS